MKRTKKNNKGFSLVELIVVVLIMAIIVVALAPQVMKWVGNSRTSADCQNYDEMFEHCQLAMAAPGKEKSTFTITISATGSTIAGTDSSAIEAELDKLNSSWKSVAKKDSAHAADYTIVFTNGALGTCVAPDGSTVQ